MYAGRRLGYPEAQDVLGKCTRGRGTVTDGDQTATSRPGWLKPMLAIAAFSIILTVASTAAVIWVGGPRQAGYPAGSPEAAFQAFVNAAQSGDWATADTFLSSNMRAQGQSSQPMVSGTLNGNVTVTIQSTTLNGSSATLSVSYAYSSGSLFGSTSYVSGANVSMILEASGWKLDSPLYGGK